MDIDLGAVTLHVRDTGGAGPAVLLLHGWPDTGDVWRHQITALSSAGYRVIAPDLRGFGASSKPAEVAKYTGRELVADVLRLLDALRLDRVHLVGHDWGGAIAWLVAARFRQRLISLTALSTPHPTAFHTAGLRQREKSWYMLLFQFPGVAEQWLCQNDFHNLRTWSAHPEIADVVRRFADPAAVSASLNLYRAMASPEQLVGSVPELPAIQVPTLGIWSSHDGALLERGMTGSAEYVVGPWRYERIDGAGHWMQLDAPDAVNALLLDHLGGAG